MKKLIFIEHDSKIIEKIQHHQRVKDRVKEQTERFPITGLPIMCLTWVFHTVNLFSTYLLHCSSQ
jgi:hypothetical protein